MTEPGMPPATDGRVCGSCGAAAAAADRFCGSCGADLDARGSRWSSWRRPRTLVIGGVVVVLVAAAGGFFLWRGGAEAAIVAPVEAYFSALADHDGPAAGRAVATAGDEAESPLWGKGALAKGYDPPAEVAYTVDYESDVEAEKIDAGHPDSKLVEVTYTLDGQDETQFFGVTYTDGGAWELTSAGLTVLQVAGDEGEAFTLNIAGLENVHGAVPSPPGVYDVAASNHPLFDDTGQPVTVGPPSPDDSPVHLDLQVSDEARAAVVDQVNTRIEWCIDQAPPLATDDCPWKDTGAEVVDAKGWKVVDEPVVKVALGDDGEVWAETTEPGKATATADGETVTAGLVPAGPVTVDPHSGEAMWSYERD